MQIRSHGREIDYKKAYGIVTQSCMVDYLKMYKISSKVIRFIMEVMKQESGINSNGENFI